MFHADGCSDYELTQLIDSVLEDAANRLDECRTVPRRRRGRSAKRSPNTAIISEAAKVKIAARLLSRSDQCS